MDADPAVVTWPDYQELYHWMCDETEGLTEVQLDFNSQDPAKPWMEWSIRRQVSHVTWMMLSVMHSRFKSFLWPDGHVPTPIRWEDHRMPNMKSDRRLDDSVHWELDDILEKAKLAVDWATKVVATVPIETLRGTERAYTATEFWLHVLPVIPRGAWIDADNPHRIHFTLEASLWMMYWESLVHLYTIQRLKRAQGLSTRVAIPRVGYLTLPEYTGEAQVAAPEPVPLR